MNKEITGLKNGDENPEAAAEEYIEKVTQRIGRARVVNAKQRTEVVSFPMIGNDRRAGTLAEEGCGCHERGGPTGWESQDRGSGCTWAMAKRTPGNFQPKPRPLNPRKPGASRRPGSRSLLLEVTWKHIDELLLVFAWCKVRLGLHQNSTPAPDWQRGTKCGQGEKGLGGGKWKCTGGIDELELGEKGVAMETERAGIPMQPIPRHSKRARVLDASREMMLEHWWYKIPTKKLKSKQNASKQRGIVYRTDDSTKPYQMAIELKRVQQCHWCNGDG